MTARDHSAESLGFLSGGGEMGERIRAFDWSKNPLGPVAMWPQSLKTAVSICLNSRFPIPLWWGPDLRLLYNDAWRPVLGQSKHPRALGSPGHEIWPEIWNIIGPMLQGVLATGQATWSDDQGLLIDRNGYLEEAYFTYSYSPIRDEAGGVGGVFSAVNETTFRVIGERRLRTLRELAAQAATAKTPEDAGRAALQTFAANTADVPFALLYLLDDDQRTARLCDCMALSADGPATPKEIRFGDVGTGAKWPIEDVVKSGRPLYVEDLAERFGAMPRGPLAVDTRCAAVLPLANATHDRIAGLLILGVNPCRELDDEHRGFQELVAGHVATAIANARAYEEERKRAEGLAELDRAKTTFFSNVSHEFRTPLTLILGPVEDALAEPDEALPARQRDRLEIARRNGVRLQKLVNTLLDFSRIEAGRARATFEPTDLSGLVADLAGNFRSACERAGLTLRVDCPPLAQPVYVDREMWEKIVLNLMSNAFKFTLQGEIAVAVRSSDRAAEVRISDTGAGISAEEIPRLFERFHRVENVPGRTHEGSGIGLALVHELVKLHKGTISVESEVGEGTTFLVSVPLGLGHLAREQVVEGRVQSRLASGVGSFVEEVLSWLPEDQPGDLRLAKSFDDEEPNGPISKSDTRDDDRPVVLVADDNADMRRYLTRLLAGHYRLEAVPDGAAAIVAVRRRMPSLILADVMMPRLDGFGLLRQLRADPHTAAVPVILLSARAGEESRVEGMEAGADDYLVKPFGARELLARVSAHLQLARLRRESSESLRQSEERFRLLFETMSEGFVVNEVLFDREGRACDLFYIEVNPAFERQTGLKRSEVLGRTTSELFRDVDPLWYEPFGNVAKTGMPAHFQARFGPLNRWFEVSVYRTGLDQIATVFFDITEQKRAEARERQLLVDTAMANAQFRAFFEQGALFAALLEIDGTMREPNRLCLEFCGYTREQVVGRPFWECPWWDRSARLMAEVERATRLASIGEQFRAELPYFMADGEERAVDLNVLPIKDESGRVIFLAANGTDITDRERAQRQLAEAHQFLNSSLDALSSHIAVLDEDGVILAVNEAWRRFADENHFQVHNYGVGSNYLKACDANLGECVEPEMVQGLEDVLRARRPSFEMEYPCHSAAARQWFVMRATRFPSPGPLRVVVSHEDITPRKEAEKALRTSESRFRLAADAVNGIIYEYDIVADVVERTRGLYEVLGYRPDEVSSSPQWWFEQTHPDDRRDRWQEVRAAAGTGRSLTSRYRVRHKDGRWLHVEDRSLVLADEQGRPVKMVGCTTDVTQRVEAEEGLREADRRKDEFLATLAHELRNPLAPIRNGLEIMSLSHGDREAVDEARAMMERQLTHMVHLVDDLLDLSRISRGKIELRKERVELAKVVQLAVETSRPLIEHAGHSLSIAMPPGLVYVDADITRLAQVFSNLLNNAAKYTDRGGRIRLSAGRVGGEVAVSVKDNGIGIPPRMLPKVFEMFTQVDRNLERAQGGLGIGLSIVKRLVEMQGGSVEAKSDGQGMGSEFIVRLPVVESPALLAAKTGNSDKAANRRRILVVDDNRDSAISLAMMLRLMGNDTKTAHDGYEALEVAEIFRPDMILLDIGMPRLNGYDTAREIRQRPWGRGILLVALTGWGQEEDRQKSREAGFDHHTVKPIEPAILEQLLAGLGPKTA